MTDIAMIARRANATGFAQGSLASVNAILAYLESVELHAAAHRVLTAWEDGTIQAIADGIVVPTAEPMLPQPAPATPPPSPIVLAALTQAQAKQQGYTGDMCSNCGSFQMKVSGHCMVYENCGQTTGCS